MKQRNFTDSLNAAVEGFIYAMKSERNMRIHFLFGVFVLMLGIYLNLSKADLLFICIAITLVLVTEMINSAVELTVDLVQNVFDPVARIIKDVAAGAVFIATVNAVIIGYIVFARALPFNVEEGILRLKESSWHTTFISLIIVFCLVVLGKVVSRKGTPFRGGMPSGHAAFAFSMWTIITFLTEKGLISILAFLLAVFVARNRISSGIHNAREVIVGGLLGMLTTALLFQVMR